MNIRLILLVVCCLFLLGCSSQFSSQSGVPHAGDSPSGYYTPGSYAEQASAGALQAFPLDMDPVSGYLPMGESILVFSDLDSGTRLTVLSGDTLTVSAECILDTFLTPEDPSLCVSPHGLHFYDGDSFLLLNTSLQETGRISVPEEHEGSPYLCREQRVLYYFGSGAIHALELDTGLHRLVKELSEPILRISGLLEDSILVLTTADEKEHTILLSAETGATLQEGSIGSRLNSCEDRYYGTWLQEGEIIPVFGQVDTQAQTLRYSSDSQFFFLPEMDAAVLTPSGKEDPLLRYVDLASGQCSASVIWQQAHDLQTVCSTEDGYVWFSAYDPQFGCETLYRWDLSLSPANESSVYSTPLYTASHPDYEGLAKCRQYADDLSSQYGLEIHIFRDAVAFQPSDYDLKLEYRVPRIHQELETLEHSLSAYPEPMLQALKEHFPKIHICIVSSLSGTGRPGSLETAEGIQFFSDTYEAYIALASGYETQYTLYHEMCHLIDTVVLNKTSVYDRWDLLNPPGFAYHYDYAGSRSQSGDQYLQNDTRYFIDRYSMCFPKEDRARIMEYAMTEGNEALFQSTHMQAKLLALCTAIREAFDLEGSREVFLWEQYLNQSLASNP